jgi:endonuclease I
MNFLPKVKIACLSLLAVLLIGCNENDQEDKLNLKLVIKTDRHGEELSWSLTDSKHEVIRSESGFESNTEYTISIGIDPGGYRFEIHDSGVDGLCCSYGEGSFQLFLEDELILSDAGTEAVNDAINQIFTDEIQHVFNTNAHSTEQYTTSLGTYYASADLLDGYELKTALHEILKANTEEKTLDDISDFFVTNSLDKYYENDDTILDLYSENPNSADSYNFTPATNLCGSETVESEGTCYVRGHIFPSDWFDGDGPMETDIHHIFPVDSKVSDERGNLPFGEINPSTATFTSNNGSRVGSGHGELEYSQPVFEPIDEFKGDFARAYLYMATRYEDDIVDDDWYGNEEETTAILSEESGDQVYQTWFIRMLLHWHELDPVSQAEIDRNNAAADFQGNRNPFIDHPDFAEYIWTHEGIEPAIYNVF